MLISGFYQGANFIYWDLHFTSTVMFTSFNPNTYNTSCKGETILELSFHSDRWLMCCYVTERRYSYYQDTKVPYKPPASEEANGNIYTCCSALLSLRQDI